MGRQIDDGSSKFPGSEGVAHWLEVFRTYYGPILEAFAALDGKRRADLEADTRHSLRNCAVIPVSALATPVYIHVVLSLVDLLAGFALLPHLLGGRKPAMGLTTLFLLTTAAATLSGFLFPITRMGLGQVVGIVSLIALAPTLLALYGHHLVGPWRALYAVGATITLYLNVLILVAQILAKTPALREIAPTQTALPFLLTQAVVLAAFAVMATLAALRFQPETDAPIPARLFAECISD